MMKLTVRIEEEKFHYSYEVGTSKQTGESPMSGDDFLAFSELLKILVRHNRYETEKHIDEVILNTKVKELMEEEFRNDEKAKVPIL